MRVVNLVLVVMVGAAFVGLWNELHAQGTLTPKESDQVVFSKPDGPASPTDAPAQGKSTRLLVSSEVPEGFAELNSGSIVMNPLDITNKVTRPGYGSVDAIIQAAEADAQRKLNEMRDKLNKIIIEQVDPTLLLKDPDSNELEANDKMKDGVKREAQTARDEVKKIMDELRQRSSDAFNACPVAPPTEPALCNSKRPATLASVEQVRSDVNRLVNVWEEKNLWAIEHPKPFIPSTDTNTSGVVEWKDGVKFIKDAKEEWEGHTEDAAGKAGSKLGDMQQEGIADR